MTTPRSAPPPPQIGEQATMRKTLSSPNLETAEVYALKYVSNISSCAEGT